jgi:hypothetical protein
MDDYSQPPIPTTYGGEIVVYGTMPIEGRQGVWLKHTFPVTLLVKDERPPDFGTKELYGAFTHLPLEAAQKLAEQLIHFVENPRREPE